MEKTNIYHENTYQECIQRIENLNPNLNPQWGEMSVAQMLAHCSLVQAVYNGNKDMVDIHPQLFEIKDLIKNSVYGNDPVPPGAPTHSQYIINDERNFLTEKEKLLFELDYMFNNPEKVVEHPLFGVNSKEANGWAYFKHLDHHLRQFGV